MKNVRAKFKMTSKTEHLGAVISVELWPVYSQDPDHENKIFWDATPSGKITMTIASRASAMFEVGREYYVDFTPAETVSD